MLDAPAQRPIHPLRPPYAAISPLLPHPSKPTASHGQRHPLHTLPLDTNTSLAPVSSLRIVSTQASPLATTTNPNKTPNAAGHHGPRQSSKNNIPDRIASSQANPLRDGTVLLLGFGELLLRAEGFVRLAGGLVWPCGWQCGDLGTGQVLTGILEDARRALSLCWGMVFGDGWMRVGFGCWCG